MEVAYVSAFAALGGSVVGGLISGVATWLAQWSQVQAGHRAHQISHREEIFRDFIVAASKAYGQAIMSHEPAIHDLIAMLAAVNRMEVLCSPRTIACAQHVATAIAEAHLRPNQTFQDILAMMKAGTVVNPLSEFNGAAREELRKLNPLLR